MIMAACDPCGKENPAYKCPTCRIPYCSINCFKAHKSGICSPPVSQNDEKNPDKSELPYRYPTEDTVPKERLSTLRESKDLKNCLNNPHVRTIMQGILEAEDPTEAIAKAMIEPIFVEMADACLRVVEPPDEIRSSG